MSTPSSVRGVAILATVIASIITIQAAELQLRHGNRQGVLGTVRRQLLATNATQHQCVWGTVGCDLNADYITSLSGTPTTDSQKLLAQVASLAKTCANYTASSTCLSNASQKCAWDNNGCYPDDELVVKPQWLSGRLACAGSLLDQYLTCSTLTTQSSCDGNSVCVWNPPNLSEFEDFFGMALSGWTYGTATLCVPKSVINATVVANLNSTIYTLASSDSTDPSAMLKALSTILIGNCPAATNFNNVLSAGCVAKSNRSACDGTPSCGWSPRMYPNGTYSGNGNCRPAQEFMTTILDSSDTWVVATRTARNQCLGFTSQTTCESSAIITVNTTRYSEFAVLQPVFANDGAAGFNDPLASLPLSLVLSLFAIFVVRRVGLT